MDNLALSPDERMRYARHLILPGLGLEGQLKLKAAKVLVVGAGGLGSPVLLYLAAAGIGTIGIIDHDRVDASNLQRQVLFGTKDIGKSKAQTAAQHLLGLNPNIQIVVYDHALNIENAMEIVAQYDIIADGTDNFPTRYLVNDACVLLGKINVHAAIFRFDGQVAVFNAPLANGERSSNYRDIFPHPPAAGSVPDCAEGGVLGVLPGIIGSMQASEVIKLAAGLGAPLVDRIFIFDALRMESRSLSIKKDPENPISGLQPSIKALVDYDLFCGIPKTASIQGISAFEFRKWEMEGRKFQLVDVREAAEYALDHLGGKLIPLGVVANETHLIARDRPVVVHCQSGNRSAKAIEILMEQGFSNLYNLEGGIVAFNALNS